MARLRARHYVAIVFFVACFLPAAPAVAQSDPSLFDTVINVPPDVAPLTVGSETQLNVLSGGELTGLAYSFGAFDGSSSNVEVNVIGGAIPGAVTVNQGADLLVAANSEVGQVSVNTGGRVRFNGGTLTNTLQVLNGGELVVSAGAFPGGVIARSGSHVEFVGGDFRVNGDLVDGPVVSLADAFFFTWTGADGEGYSLTGDDPSRNLRVGDVTLTRVAVPPVDPTPMVVDNPLMTPPSLRPGEVLELRDGGALPHNVVARPGTTYNIVGGVVGAGFNALPGSAVRVSGGVIERGVTAAAGSVELVGAEFYLNGRPLEADVFSSAAGGDFPSVFTGVLENGDFIRFDGAADDRVVGVFDSLVEARLSRVEPPTRADGPIIVDSSSTEAPRALRPGQSLVLNDGGAAPNGFYAVASEVRFEGGRGAAELINATATISAGTGDISVNAVHDSIVRVQGGISEVSLSSGSEALVEAGEVAVLELGPQSHATIDGGAVHFARMVATPDREASLLVRGGDVGSVGVRRPSFDGEYPTQIQIEGGSVGDVDLAAGSRVDVLGGMVGTIDGISSSARRSPDSPADIGLYGGEVDSIFVSEGRVLELVGAFPANLWTSGAIINIRGGARNEQQGFESLRTSPLDRSTFNLFGSDFLLDGEPIEGLLTNEPVDIPPVDGLLTATLADGSVFQVALSTDVLLQDGLGSLSRLTITLVPEPTAVLIAITAMIGVASSNRSVAKKRRRHSNGRRIDLSGSVSS